MLEPDGRSEAGPTPKVTRLFVCSSNQGKLRDFSWAARSRAEDNIAIEPLPGLAHISPPEENGSTFEQNATAKAIYYSAFTQELVLADDSGLEVDALHGAPGVHSARYAGPGATDTDNNKLLLSDLAQAGKRDARFVCVLAIARQSKLLFTATGSVDGTILTAPQGSGGFGYDSLFFYPPLKRSFGELTGDEKLAVSHRGRALRQLFERLPEIFVL